MSVSETFQVGEFTTLERLELLPQNGTIVYDSTIGVLSVYQSGAWFLLSGASGIVSISSNTLSITGTNTDPIIDLMPSGIVANLYQFPTVTFNQYGIATAAVSNTVVLGISSTTLTLGGTSSNPTINLTPSGIVSGSYQFPTVTFNQYGIATSAVSNTAVLGISSTTLTIGGTASNPTVNLTPSGIIANTYTLATVTFDQYGIAHNAVSNTLSGTTNQINVSSFPNAVISLNAAFITTVNGKVDRSGDTMAGPLNSSFAGSASSPNFAINSSNGIFQTSTNHLNLATNGANRLDIDNTGKISITSLSTGVVHSDSNGLLTSSLVTNSEIKTQTPLSNPDSIVSRDTSKNFAANMITLSGATINGTDVATKNYVDTAVSLGLSVKQPVVAVSVVPISSPPSGAHTFDSTVVLVNGDRALLVAQASGEEKYNGAWVVNTAGAWTRPSDFNTGDSAGAAYFLVQMGTNYAGSSWVCSTPSAVIGTNPLVFAQFSSPQSATGHNDSPEDGLVYNNSIGSTLHFRSLLNDVNGYLTMTNLTNSVQFAINATSANTANAIVARDGSQNFSANNITLTSGLLVSAGSFGSPSVQVGPVSTGISSAAGNLQLSTAFGIGVSIASATGIVTIPNLNAIGIVHNSVSGVLSTSLILDSDVDPNAGIVDTKLATISTVGKVSNTATTATSALGINTIVSRDGSNNFVAGTITATLNGNATTATSFSGSLVGDVTGTQSATVVSFVGGVTSANVASGANFANTATNLNTFSTIVKRDPAGNFTATTITANLTGNATTANSATSFSGSLLGDVTGTQSATVVSFVDGVTAANVATGVTLANAATNLNTFSTLVKRDGAGNFTATTITANLTGNASGNLLLTGGTLTGVLTTTPGTAALPALLIGGSTCGFSFVGGALQISLGNTLALSLGSALGLGVLHSTSGSVVTSSPIVNADIATGAVTDAKITGPLTSALLVSNSATTASSALGINTIVLRDGSNNFVAGTITATLNGNASSANNFSGSLSGDVTGTQSATVVSFVGGVTSTNVASGANFANAATNLNTFSTIVKRDPAGNFTATTITGNLIGNATTATTATNFSGSLLGDVTGTQSATVVSFVGGVTSANVASGVTLANAATNLNTFSTIVKRDSGGNFTAGTITAALSGNATSATTATSFSGSLLGDVTGTQSTTVVSFVGGVTSANVASGVTLANAATNLNTFSTIVKRDSGGNFTAGTITANLTGNATTATTATSFSGSLVGDVTGTQSATVISFVGGVTSANVASGANLANAATNLNTFSTIVKRDSGGNFTAGTITATLTGSASLNLLLTGGTLTGDLAMGVNNITGTGTIGANIFNSAGTTDASSATTGSILTAGGMSCQKANYVGTNLHVLGTTDATTSTSGSIQCLGGVGILKSINIGSTASSASVSTGSIVSAGGLGLAKNIIAGGVIQTTDSTAASSTITGSIITAGGLGIGKSAYIGQDVVCTQALYGRTSQPAVLSKCTQTVARVIPDTSSGTPISFFGSSIGSLTYAANTTNIGMTIDCTAFFNVTANTSTMWFGFNVNGGATTNTANITTTTKGMVNFKIRIDSAGGMTCTIGVYKDSASPLFTFATPSGWTISSSNAIDFNVTWNSSASTSSVTISQAIITNTYNT